jgi:hypothetical protein
MGGLGIQMPWIDKAIQARHLHRLHKANCPIICEPFHWLQ